MTNAQAVSRVLRANGYGVVTSRSREGLYVTRGTEGATVFVQLDAETKATRRAKEVSEFLREKGFTVRQNGTILLVTRES